MTRSPLFLALFLVTLIGFVAGSPDAHAKRFGGGGSFGGKSSFSTPFKRPAAAPARSPRQQQAAQQNASARQGLAQRGGLMGMLGGLAIGGLLGALFFGGAFENINFLDILVFGAIAFMLFKLLAARSARPATRTAGGGFSSAGGTAEAPPVQGRSGSGFDSADWFRGGNATAGTASPDAPAASALAVPTIPADFDSDGFLVGARNAYHDLQRAWDARDHDTLRGLTTATMYREVSARLDELGDDNRTDVLKVEAELLEVQDLGEMLEATVLFDALLREDAGTRPHQVREVWHFTRARDSARPTWYLDGIQQLADD
ncbi:MAG: Tim44-like domain-containing protein [Gammaproteobacteria bacterium]